MLKPGDDIGGYHIERKLGEGGMGVVFLAEQVSLQRKVALKLLPPALAKDQTYVQKFQREATSAAKISHQNIVQVYDVGTDKGIHYLAMEFVDGESLKDMIESLKRISWQASFDVLKQSLHGIERAHEAGIIHRDIKPDNIMITQKAEVKVADFGLAKAASGDSSLTMEGMVVGTPYYMSPEQIESKILTGQTDIYSLGITMWHCLVGRPPFKGDTPMKTVLKHLNEPLPDLREEVNDIPEGYVRIIEKMCAKDPKSRYRTARAVLDALRAFEKSVGGGGSSQKESHKDKTHHYSRAQKSSTHTRSGISDTQRFVRDDIFEDFDEKPARRFGCGGIFVGCMALAVLAWFISPNSFKNKVYYKADVWWTDIKHSFSNTHIDAISATQQQGYIDDAQKAEADGFIDQAIYLLKKANEIDERSDIKENIYRLEQRKKEIRK